MAASGAMLPGTGMDDIEERLFVQGVGQEVMDSWMAKEAASTRPSGTASVLDSDLGQLALECLPKLSDRFVALALETRTLDPRDLSMKRMEVLSQAIGIFYRLDDRVLLGAAASLELETADLQELQREELLRSCWAVALLAVKTCAGKSSPAANHGEMRHKAPPGTEERELDILRALGWAVCCPSLFSWTCFFQLRLQALQRTALGAQVTNDWMSANLSMISDMIANAEQPLSPRLIAGGILYFALMKVCRQHGIEESVIEEEIASLVWVTGLDRDTIVESGLWCAMLWRPGSL
eukprot:TRINITY_DN6815_c0_g1_i1.p1 TRINITY_DN6815_c0_g1~~TRINITY_DN6815_c0_g1_i1.p1  ORF type:complete len:294 (+),score=65.63 TRINITY_DN6815_c0_g1_i1:46-927(+)